MRSFAASSIERFARIFALDIARAVVSMRWVPYSYLPPDELRKRIARALYAEAQRERPEWIDEKLLRPGQVAALFQVSRRTVSSLSLTTCARKGRPPNTTSGWARRL